MCSSDLFRERRDLSRDGQRMTQRRQINTYMHRQFIMQRADQRCANQTIHAEARMKTDVIGSKGMTHPGIHRARSEAPALSDASANRCQ